MLAIKGRISRALQVGSEVATCDNSGAKKIKIFSVTNRNSVKGRPQSAGIGDLTLASVIRGKPEMKNQVVFAVIVRQRKEFRRPNGMMVKFEDNSAVVLKDEKGAPKGTIFKGPIAKEVVERWPGIAKVARMVL